MRRLVCESSGLAVRCRAISLHVVHQILECVHLMRRQTVKRDGVVADTLHDLQLEKMKKFPLYILYTIKVNKGVDETQKVGRVLGPDKDMVYSWARRQRRGLRHSEQH